MSAVDTLQPLDESRISDADRWILTRYHRASADVIAALESFRFNEAASRVYQFIWHELCDWYIELVKPRLYEGSPEEKAASARVLRDVLDGRPVKRVLVTHFHPDHMGLASWLVQRYDAELWMSLSEWLCAHFAFEARERNIETMLAFWRRNGMSTETVDGMRGRGNFYAQNVVRPPVEYRRMQHGDVIEIGERAWQVIVGRGHSPEHICLACPEDGLLIAGDQVLPRITTNISVQYYEPDADPLRLFLDSTHAFATLPQDTLTLPSHDRPFYRLHERLAQLREHHRMRLDDAWDACRIPQHAIDMLPVLFHRPLDLHQQSFAIGESIAHLHRLLYEGRLARVVGNDGVLRFLRTD